MQELDYSRKNRIRSERIGNWHLRYDPAGVLKVGDVVGVMKVYGFCCPCGEGLGRLMVQIAYRAEDGEFPDTHSTTIDYLTLVRAVALSWRLNLMPEATC